MLKNMSMERMGKPLDAWLQRDREFVKSREWYHRLLESLKKELKASQGGSGLVMRLDDAVGEYSRHYGEVAYVLGFHDGLEIGIEHGDQYGQYIHHPLEMFKKALIKSSLPLKLK